MPPRWLLAVICTSVFLASTPWFAGTAVAPQLAVQWDLSEAASAWLTTSVQLGFIAGTLVFAVANVADRFSARSVFTVSALVAAAANLGFAWLSTGFVAALCFRFATGVALAGVYPVAMKIVAAWYRDGLGWRLGAMVGALTLGTAAPYLLRTLAGGADWRVLASFASVAALVGAALLGGLVADGPHLPRRSPFKLDALAEAFSSPAFRGAALGYFGHMWELYAVWSLMAGYVAAALSPAAAPAVAFSVVGVGTIGCVVGGALSGRFGERGVARAALIVSGLCCLLSPVAFAWPPSLLVPFLLVWGLAVVADSAQFSALAAATCPAAYTGSALTLMNGVGYAITVVTIALVSAVAGAVGWRWAFLPLAAGPMVGLVALRWAPARAVRA